MADENMTQSRKDFTEKVNAILGDGFEYKDFATDLELESFNTPTFEAYSDNDDGGMPPADNADGDVEVDTYDQYVGAEVNLPIGDTVMSGKVRGHKRMSDGSLVGKLNANPILDTRTYEVEFADGQTAELAVANVIAQNMYAMCNIEGNQ
jgi:hypothetical protein